MKTRDNNYWTKEVSKLNTDDFYTIPEEEIKIMKEKYTSSTGDRLMADIWVNVQQNRRRREKCTIHDFVESKRIGKYKCKNCGCEEDSSFVIAYNQGIEHGKNISIMKIREAFGYSKDVNHVSDENAKPKLLEKLEKVCM